MLSKLYLNHKYKRQILWNSCSKEKNLTVLLENSKSPSSSSNINEVIKGVLNPLSFFYNKFHKYKKA